jgi:hypothetical protein
MPNTCATSFFCVAAVKGGLALVLGATQITQKDIFAPITLILKGFRVSKFSTLLPKRPHLLLKLLRTTQRTQDHDRRKQANN